MGKKSRERRERHEQRMAEVQRARVAQSGTFWDKLMRVSLEQENAQRDAEKQRFAHFWHTDEYLPGDDLKEFPLSFVNVMIRNSIIIDGSDIYHQIAYNTISAAMDNYQIWELDEYSILPMESIFVEFGRSSNDCPIVVFCSSSGNTYNAVGVHFMLMDDFDWDDSIIYITVYGESEFDGKTEQIGTCGLRVKNREIAIEIEDYGSPNQQERVLSILYPALEVLKLMNCRNIELVDHAPDPAASQEYERHFGRPLTTYKTLRIKPTGKRYGDGGELKPYQGIMPLHIRRGNFATYTDDAPLFGKYTGTFWRPATAVGERENGIAVKDYEVVSPA